MEILFYLIPIIIGFFIAMVGSLNGLGVSFLLSLALMIFEPNHLQTYQWTIYLTSIIVTFIFVFSRPRLLLDNFYSIIVISSFTGMGLMIGKIITTHHSYTVLKIFFSFILVSAALILNKYNLIPAHSNEIKERNISFDFFDIIIFLLIGFTAVYFDFGMAAFVYIYMFTKKLFFNIEKIDICVYATLLISSVVKMLFTIMRHEQFIPNYFGFGFILSIILGSIGARVIYKYFSPTMRVRIVMTGFFSIGLKIFAVNLAILIFH